MSNNIQGYNINVSNNGIIKNLNSNNGNIGNITSTNITTSNLVTDHLTINELLTLNNLESNKMKLLDNVQPIEFLNGGINYKLSSAHLKSIYDLGGANLASKTYVDDKIDQLINGASASFDTLKEIENKLNDTSATTSILSQIGNKANLNTDNTFTSGLNTFNNNVKINGTINDIDFDSKITSYDNTFSSITTDISSLKLKTTTHDDNITTINNKLTVNDTKNLIQDNNIANINDKLITNDVNILNLTNTKMNTFDLTNYNTKNEITNNYFNKSDVNTLLDNKVSNSYLTSNVYLKSDINSAFYSKTEANNLLNNKAGLSTNNTYSGVNIYQGDISVIGKINNTDLTDKIALINNKLNDNDTSTSTLGNAVTLCNSAITNIDSKVNKNLSDQTIINSSQTVTNNNIQTQVTNNLNNQNTINSTQTITNTNLQTQVTNNLTNLTNAKTDFNTRINNLNSPSTLFISGDTNLASGLTNGIFIELIGYNNFNSSYIVTLPLDMTSRSGLQLTFMNRSSQTITLKDSINNSNIQCYNNQVMILMSDTVTWKLIYDSNIVTNLLTDFTATKANQQSQITTNLNNQNTTNTNVQNQIDTNLLNQNTINTNQNITNSSIDLKVQGVLMNSGINNGLYKIGKLSNFNNYEFPSFEILIYCNSSVIKVNGGISNSGSNTIVNVCYEEITFNNNLLISQTYKIYYYFINNDIEFYIDLPQWFVGSVKAFSTKSFFTPLFSLTNNVTVDNLVLPRDGLRQIYRNSYTRELLCGYYLDQYVGTNAYNYQPVLSSIRRTNIPVNGIDKVIVNRGYKFELYNNYDYTNDGGITPQICDNSFGTTAQIFDLNNDLKNNTNSIRVYYLDGKEITMSFLS